MRALPTLLPAPPAGSFACAARGVAAVALLALAAGCSLNPQPLPPGETADGGGSMATPGEDAGAGTAADGGGLFGGGDATTSTDAGVPVPPGAEAGGSSPDASAKADGGEGDAGADTGAGPLDGATDAPATQGQDASNDGATE